MVEFNIKYFKIFKFNFIIGRGICICDRSRNFYDLARIGEGVTNTSPSCLRSCQNLKQIFVKQNVYINNDLNSKIFFKYTNLRYLFLIFFSGEVLRDTEKPSYFLKSVSKHTQELVIKLKNRSKILNS